MYDADTGTVTISGSGAMTNYSAASDVPWYSYIESITSAVIADGVTSIGNRAFFSCTGLKSITIPDSVTSIGEDSFYNCCRLVSITIPDSVTSIGNEAFLNCSLLTSVTLPDTITNIGYMLFCNCTNLVSITIPNSVKSIGDWAFENCKNLKSITIPVSVTSVGTKAFYCCDSLEYVFYSGDSDDWNKITIGDSNTNLKCACIHYNSTGHTYSTPVYTLSDDGKTWTSKSACTYEGCTEQKTEVIDNVTSSGSCGYTLTWVLANDGKLYIYGSGAMTNYSSSSTAPWYSYKDNVVSVIIADGVTSIGSYAFYGCSSLTSITIPDSVTSIGSYAFRGCSSLTSVTIPDRVTSIGYFAFYGCSSLTSVTIPDRVTSIGIWAFYGCSSLTSVTIPDSVTSIGESAFRSCSRLTSVTIPSSVTSIGESAFQNCSSLKTVYYTGSTADWCNIDFSNGYSNPTYYSADVYFNGTLVTEIEIPDSVTSIKKYAFYGFKDLTTVTIPGGVTSIGDEAFRGCSSLTSINVASDNTVYCSVDGVLLNKAKTKLITCPEGKAGAYTVPTGVISISAYAFYNCSSLTSVTIPNSVTSIGDSAFYGCSSLKYVFYAGSKSDWSNITIGDYNTCLTSAAIHYNATDHSYTDDICTVCGALSADFDGLAGGKCGESVLWKLSSDYVLTVSGSGAMYSYSSSDAPWYSYRKSISSAVIADGVTSIGDAFAGCSSLTSITIPNSVTSIGSYAFQCCSSLTSVTIPDSVSSIGDGAFYGCSSLAEIHFDGNAPEIDWPAFLNVTATAYYPAGNKTWTDDVRQNYGGTLTWVGVCDAPVITGAYNYAGYIKVVWNAVDGAEKYRLSYRKGTGDWVKVCDTTATRVNITDLEDGASYTFMVVCISADGKTLTSDYSNRASQIRLLTPAATVTRFGKAGTVSGSGFKVSWNATTGGSCYKVYYREKGGSWALYANYAKSNNTRYVNIKADQTNAETTAGAKFPDLLIGHTYEFVVLTATSQASITSGFPTTYTGYKF